jgi:hypothetical protein
MNYTKGPWKVDDDFICDVVAGDLKISTSWSEDEAGMKLKVADRPMPSAKEQEANTRLIAAAPAMYEALQKIYEGNNMEGVAEYSLQDVLQKHYQIARGAIKLIS